jgi:ELWxxDGT repeat protein
VANDGASGDELWKSDGTTVGTVRVKDILPGSGSSNLRYLTNMNGTLYFAANDGVSGTELWRSDGTSAGTTIVKDIFAGPTRSAPSKLIDVSGTLYFIAYGGPSGYELWKSNGTEAGTVLVKDIQVGIAGPAIRYLTNVDGKLFFNANDGATGSELWMSDGTEAGTVLVEDFIPGTLSGNPNVISQIGNLLYVVATTLEYGSELWSAKLFDYGDYNRDGQITPADHTFWAANFGATTGVGLQADGNNDGVVDAADYNIWRDNYTPPPAAVAIATSAVSGPEMGFLPQPSSPRSVAPRLLGGVARIAESPRRREALLIAAREAAIVELASDSAAPCGPLAHGSGSEADGESAARDGVFELLGRGGL